jgi:hypothetical protein
MLCDQRGAVTFGAALRVDVQTRASLYSLQLALAGNCSAMVAVFARVVLARFVGVLACMHGVSMGNMRVVGGLLMITGFMMFGCLVVMFRGVLMMLCCFAVMLSSLVGHRLISLDLE